MKFAFCLIIVALIELSLSQTDSSIEKLILYRFDKVLNFLENEYKSINLDGLYGIRTAQGALNDYKTLNNDNKRIVKGLTNRLNALTNIALKQVQIDDKMYYDQFKYLIERPFDFHVNNDIPLNVTYYKQELNLKKLNNFNEKFSDSCYTLLLQSFSNGDCKTDDKCLNYYTLPNTSGYFLTHQLLYFIMAKHVNCSDNIVSRLTEYLSQNDNNKALAQLLDNKQDKLEANENSLFSYYCSKVYQESKQMSEQKNFHRDLFIEQLTLCTLSGYHKEFLRQDWIENVLRFQSENGCFGNYPANKIGLLNEHDSMEETYNSLIEQSRRPITEKRRIKRVDRQMKQGCSSHETGLAIGILGLNLKYLLD